MAVVVFFNRTNRRPLCLSKNWVRRGDLCGASAHDRLGKASRMWRSVPRRERTSSTSAMGQKRWSANWRDHGQGCAGRAERRTASGSCLKHGEPSEWARFGRKRNDCFGDRHRRKLPSNPHQLGDGRVPRPFGSGRNAPQAEINSMPISGPLLCAQAVSKSDVRAARRRPNDRVAPYRRGLRGWRAGTPALRRAIQSRKRSTLDSNVGSS
jgi:hypothetical protein